MIADDKRELQA